MGPKIVGVALIKNEENFIVWSLMNAVDFCDQIIVLDNESSDRTHEKVSILARLHPTKLVVHRVPDPNDTHGFVSRYVDTPTWIFGIDGDEVYDPSGLARLRDRIKAGEFAAYWRISGAVLHAVTIDLDAGRATGYRTPPSADNTKLFNFAALDSWDETYRERLHGGGKRFKANIVPHSTYHVPARDGGWERSDFRCLHLCFAPRSSLENASALDRKNPSQVSAKWRRRVFHFLRHAFRGGYKRSQYARGEIVAAEIAAFGRPTNWANEDVWAADTEAQLSRLRDR